jgi:hypothetical protein
MAETAFKGKACTVKVNLDIFNNIYELFQPGGELQKFIDMEIARLADDYAPSDTGSLRKSVFIKSTFGNGLLIYEIYGNPDGRNTWNDTTSTFQGAPTRGCCWIPRMLDAGGREKLRLEIQRFIEKRG